ncbi:amidase signature domain-containing protein, partial [Melampsora americana]
TISIKDIFSLKNQTNTCASKFLKDFKPSYDSTVVSKLKKSGIKILGKTNMDEFSMGSSSSFSHFGSVLNPIESFNSKSFKTSGGSSGGSAVTVASGISRSVMRIGSDTGGSTRLPAAYCGIIGLKPSYGIISRYGMVQYSHSLDCVGLFSKSIDSIQILFNTLVGYDERDPTSVIWKSNSLIKTSTKDLSDLRIGIPIEYYSKDLNPKLFQKLRQVASILRSRGATLVSVSLPSTSFSLGAYYVIASAEASSNLARYSGVYYGYRDSKEEIDDSSEDLDEFNQVESSFVESRSNGFGEEVKRRILLGNYTLSASGMENYFLKAQLIRKRICEEFDQVWRKTDLEEMNLSSHSQVDILLTPPTLSIAPNLKLEEDHSNEKEVGDEIRKTWGQDQLLVPASLAGLPSLVVMMMIILAQKKWPIGVQFIGPWGSEISLFRVGKVIEEEREGNGLKDSD